MYRADQCLSKLGGEHMGNVSVALCIPTYQRSEIVEEFLSECAEYYLDAGMDIYFYDGSEDTKTEDVVRKYQESSRIYYIKRPENYNTLMIFEGYGRTKEYDFIWLFGDASRYTKEAVEEIVFNLKLEYDVICVDGTDCSKTETQTFSKPQEFMRKCAWRVDYVGGTLINWHTMLSNIDWAAYNKEYRKICAEILPHSWFYWRRALDLKQFCALFLELQKTQSDWSVLKKSSSWSRDHLFYSLCEKWVKTFECLPGGYSEEDKRVAILKLGEVCFFKDMTQFLLYRRKGIFSFKVFLKYRGTWKKVTQVSKWKICMASLVPRNWLDFVKKPMKNRLKGFCKAHSRIIIYGAAFWGRAYAEYLDQCGIKYDGFCCTKRKPGKYEFCQHPVYVFDEIKRDFDENVGIIVAIEHAQEVMAKLEREIDRKQFFYEPELGKELRYQLGYQN